MSSAKIRDNMAGAMAVRPAGAEDADSILSVLDAARGIMRASGNMQQWAGGYPSREVILSDIRSGFGYVVVQTCARAGGERIVGYFAFIPSPEPTYEQIFDGSWPEGTDSYHVVHRIGSVPEAHGVFRTVMDWCFLHERTIRIDTHRDNSIMRHCLSAYGFSCCGIIYLTDGSPRLAFSKSLPA